jgi:Gas vesicle synthesis protein GvpL/GvpF
MTETREDAAAQTRADALVADEWGWYLYGITRRGALATTQPERGNGARGTAVLALDLGRDEGEPVQALDCGALAAIVRRVPLAQFSEDALRARHDDTAWFAEMAHHHNRVIAAIHQQQTILPAKFGSIYARAEDVQMAVAAAREALLAQLERVEGCDEWAVHVFAARPAIEQRVSAEHPILQQLQHDLATASPGRAYFLQRKLDEERAAATDQALRDLAQAAYDRLARWAAASWPKATRRQSPRGGAGRVTPPARSAPAAHGEIEILRAAFLVPRANADTFLAEVRSCIEGRDGVRCEYSGPWAPYSFAVPTEEEKP